jgi:hypothetical protein
MGNLSISSDIYRYFYIYLLCVVFQYVVNCVFCMKRYSHLRVFKKLGYLSYFFSSICKRDPFCSWYFGSSCMFCFCGCDSDISSRFVLYSFFCNTFYSVFSVCFYFCVIGYVCNLFSRYLIPDNLCSCGWHKLLGIMISFSVGFSYIENSELFCLRCIVMSK